MSEKRLMENCMKNDTGILGEAELKNEIKSGASGGYFFYGDEDYLKSFYAAELVKSVADDESGFGEFNHIIINTDAFDGAALENALASLPLMSERKIVEMRSPDISSWREKEKNEFTDIISRLDRYPHTVFLVTVNRDCFDEGNPPKRPSAMFKTIAKYIKPVAFELQSESKLARWIERRAAKSGVSVSPDVSSRVIRMCGRDMRYLAGETDKLIAYTLAHGENSVRSEYVPLVCSETSADDAFELANAVIAGDRTRALNALLSYKQRKEEPIAVLASVSRTVCDLLCSAIILEDGGDKKDIASSLKIHEYRAELYKNAVTGVNPDRLRAALDRCRKTDVLLKSTTLGYIALERLISTIPQLSKIRKQ